MSLRVQKAVSWEIEIYLPMFELKSGNRYAGFVRLLCEKYKEQY
jgi:hypothetical protein